MEHTRKQGVTDTEYLRVSKKADEIRKHLVYWSNGIFQRPLNDSI